MSGAGDRLFRPGAQQADVQVAGVLEPDLDAAPDDEDASGEADFVDEFDDIDEEELAELLRGEA